MRVDVNLLRRFDPRLMRDATRQAKEDDLARLTYKMVKAIRNKKK